MQCAKGKVQKEKIIVRLFQVIRHQGSEQVSKPDIHHVDFLFVCHSCCRRKVEGLTIKVYQVSLKCRENVVSGGRGYR
jgi:hypothetical protein